MHDAIIIADKVTKIFDTIIKNEDLRNLGLRTLISTLFPKKKLNPETKSFCALSEVTFSLKRGKSCGIIGLNGAGKTTLLQIISNTMQPSKGSIKLNGKVTALLELGSGFNPEFTGIENIYLTAYLHGLKKEEIDFKLSSIIDFANIGDFISQPVKAYSTGMTLRLAFAVTAHVEADVLIIDEALVVGDARFQLKCFAFLEKFKKKGGSLLLVSHDLNSIARLCEESILLHKGQVLKSGKTVNIINHYSKLIAENQHEKKLSKGKKTKMNQIENSVVKSTDEIEPISYGGEIGAIKAIRFNNSENQIIRSGEKFSVSFKAISYQEIEEPIFAIRIRDCYGQEIYGTNTKFLKVQNSTSINCRNFKS